MKINPKILSIPPFISTSWKNVLSLHMENRSGSVVLLIGLVNGSTIEIPNLDQKVLEATFAAHQKFVELDATKEEGPKAPMQPPLFQGGLMDESAGLIRLPIDLGIDGNMGNLLQHNQDAADSPNLPPEVLEKIAAFSKAIDLGNMDNFPKPEPHCNCMHCQIMRVMRNDEPLEIEEEITAEDLKFRDWEIKQEGDRLYIVTNPLNHEEHYNVFLGKPVGCTCGSKDCEHIKAVLNS